MMTPNRSISLEMMALKELKPYEHNAKKHPRYQIEQIKQSILTFGNNDPIAIDENHVIIEGHGRYLALSELGYEQVPVIKLLHLTEEEKAAYILAHNKITLNTDFDVDILKKELGAIGIDMTEYGFSSKIITSTYLEVPSFEEALPKETSTNDDLAVEQGAIYQLGEHRLMCGDSTNPDHLASLLEGAQVDLYLTDPPYNVAYEGNKTKRDAIANDNLSMSDFMDFLTAAFSAIDPFLKAGAAFYIWHADSSRLAFSTAIQRTGWLEKQCLIWVKSKFTLSRQDYQWQHEPCLYGWKGGASHYFVPNFALSTTMEEDLTSKSKQELIELLRHYQQQLTTTVLRHDTPNISEGHPTMKPVSLLESLILNSSRQGELVFDSFAGSGSTLMACQHQGRRSYNIELEPKYVRFILERFEQAFGIKPVRIK